MSSGTYERAFKLFSSVYQLILNGRRHLETVCAKLQAIVFEAEGWPEYKNWPAICELGTHDRMAMMLIGTMPLERHEFEDRIRAAFPDCFSSTPTEGPIPLSVVRMFAARLSDLGDSGLAEHPVSLGVHEQLAIPVVGFDKFGKNRAGIKRAGGFPLPPTISSDVQQGEIVQWEGKNVVVLENNRSSDEIWVAPAERVAVSL